ncbi:MAG: LysM peptidoglycan-binding domain-containing protein [Chloroflexi bacterium]|nr:LysM peptidoglycan-binding domain-containing protein [Chloroflexota bacterium]
MRRVALLLALIVALGGCELAGTSSSSPLSSTSNSSPSPASSPEKEAAPTSTVGPVVHVVKEGETLWGISLQYGIRMEDILEANNLSDPNRIEAGQELLIPLGGPAGPVNAATAAALATFTPVVDYPFKLTTWVARVTPFVSGKETIYAKLTSYDVGVKGAQMYAVVHFESGDERLVASKASDGSGTASVEFPVKKGKRGVTVLVDVYVDTRDRTFRSQVTFTPQ